MPLGIGPLELAIVLVIVLVIFGPKKLPGLGKSLGTGMREFKDSITGGKDDDDKPSKLAASNDDDDKPSKLAASNDDDEHPPARAASKDEPITPEQHDDAVSRPRG